MGKLIKNHLARLIVMTAATYHIAASLHGFFWPKFFFDFLTKNFDPAVKPVPILQTINLIFGFINLAWEWPLEFIAGTAIHRSLELRILLLPLSSLAAVLLYQGTNPALYYIVGCGVYFWAYAEGEVCCILTSLAYGYADQHNRLSVRSLGRYRDGQAIRNR
ncbi:hypothetical protein E4T49_07112 [Aureobasidium sp. EXF-10728]|nr:hypothetical protein E4T49_07112 [Aureobasidium sp. EXF-10728]